MRIPDRWDRLLTWRARHLSDRYFIILVSVSIGFIAGLAAWVLKTAVFRIEGLLTGGLLSSSGNALFVLYPVAGVMLTILFFRHIIRDKVTHGIPRILYVLSRLKGRMKRHKTYSSLIGASLTAGFGGSIGLESPIISTGSAFGSLFGQGLRFNYRQRMLLIGCGASGAMASIFTTPVAAVIFSLEVLMLDLSTASIIPLFAASATGAITTKLLLSERILFNFNVNTPFEVADVPSYIMLGLLCGLISIYFYHAHFALSGWLERLKNEYGRALVGLGTLGVLIFFFPALYGEGYEMIRNIIHGQEGHILDNSLFSGYGDHLGVLLGYTLLVLLLKVVATTLTLGAGGVGGIFAPSAMMGGLSGYLLAHGFNYLGIGRVLEVKNFTLVGMAGVLGAVLHAPLTAIFLIAEMTKGYELIVPLMLTTAIAFLTSKAVNAHSIFTRRLAERGDLLAHHRDQAVLTLMKIGDVIDRDFQNLPPEASIRDLTEKIPLTTRNIFPVVGPDGTFHGIIDLDQKVRQDMFRKEKQDAPILDYMIQPIDRISTHESMESVLDKFKRTGYYNLPVIEDGKYIGFVSRAQVFNAYRKTLLELSMSQEA